MEPLPHRYLLVLPIPIYRDSKGVHWADQLWAKDLSRHLDYLEHLVLACPCISGSPTELGYVPIDHERLRIVALPSRFKSSLALPLIAYRLWREVDHAEVVHTGLSGWLPTSLTNIAILAAKLDHRFLFINVESSPWRLIPGQTVSPLKRAAAWAAERMNRYSLKHADLAVFTQPEYAESLMPQGNQKAHVIQASWIDQQNIVLDEAVRARWSEVDSRKLRFLFAGRLTAAKGVNVLLEAITRVDQMGLDCEVHFIGQGELRDLCAGISARLKFVRIQVLEPVPYTQAFFALLGSYHAVLVPTLTDEQPRIVYDAYSQGVSVLASDTGGHRVCVEDGQTGRLFRSGNADALADLLLWSVKHPEDLMRMGLSGLQKARAMTHQDMHRTRWQLLSQKLPARREG